VGGCRDAKQDGPHLRAAMRLLRSLSLLLLLALATASCDGLREVACAAAPGCAWCESAAVPSACYTKEDAAKLPPAVFTCKSKKEGGGVGVEVMMLGDE